MNSSELQAKKIKSELSQLQEELEKLKAQAAVEETENRSEFDRYLDTLDEKSAAVSIQLESLEDTSSDALDEINRELREARQRLAIAKRAAVAKFH